MSWRMIDERRVLVFRSNKRAMPMGPKDMIYVLAAALDVNEPLTSWVVEQF
jgi:hypothetical protein